MIRTIITFLLMFSVAQSALADPTTRVEIEPDQRAALGIEVGPAEPSEWIRSPRLPGRITLQNNRVQLITARLSGVLVRLDVGVGDSVETGQVVGHIESPEFVSLQRDFLEAASQLDLARSTAEREVGLVESGIIAGRRAIESGAHLREARAQARNTRQALLVSGMRDEEVISLRRSGRLETSLALRAPIAGVILEQFSQVGTRLAAGDPVYRVGNAEGLQVDVHTPTEVAHGLRVGSRFHISEQDASGEVVAVGTQLHPVDQGVLVRGEILSASTRLSPGQFVRVEFETPSNEKGTYRLPDTAVIHAGGRAWVFREVPGGFETLPVRILGGTGRELIVSTSVSGEVALVLRGTAALKALWLANGGPN
jgi:multidrug efflux pump subunit AcrA (membrane-fusion protein)